MSLILFGMVLQTQRIRNLVNRKSKPCNTINFQQWFLVNLWCGVLGNKLTDWTHVIQGCYPPRILNFWGEKELPLYLEDMPLATRRRMCLKNERATPHFGRQKMEFFNKILKEDGLEQMDRWPSLSLNLNPHFFLWGCMKGRVYHGYMQEGSLTTTSRNIRYI